MSQIRNIVPLLLIILMFSFSIISCSSNKTDSPQSRKSIVEKPVGRKTEIIKQKKPKPDKNDKTITPLQPSPASRKHIKLDNFNHDYLGEWFALASTAQFNINITNGRLSIEGIDISDQEAFEFSHVRWVNGSINGTILMPSTHFKSEFELIIIDENTIHCMLTNVQKSKIVWIRNSNYIKPD